eukprot:07086.XXX_407540_407704_1 [CDS] Oithona nana genome sequencing.
MPLSSQSMIAMKLELPPCNALKIHWALLQNACFAFVMSSIPSLAVMASVTTNKP